MKKKYLLAFLILAVFVSVTVYIVHLYHANLFTCTADVNFTVMKDDQNIGLDSDYDFVISPDGKASINVSGTLAINGKNYDLNRTYFLDYQKKAGDLYYTLTLTHSEVHKLDNTPGEVFDTYFIAQRAGIPFFMKISRLNKELYLVEGLKRTYFTCLRQ